MGQADSRHRLDGIDARVLRFQRQNVVIDSVGDQETAKGGA
jgi:hypothetical protein